ncbi:hypothetical protein QM012_000050 [Aureobasidium pullulans]|uniref:Uncharacterized protein n=1 Tax=Aureobasidium pullulans TaxID=5580 RepID=A0ABR0TUT0_AURPU
MPVGYEDMNLRRKSKSVPNSSGSEVPNSMPSSTEVGSKAHTAKDYADDEKSI